MDLILRQGDGIVPIEIKAGETVSSDFFKGLRAFARLYAEPPPNGGILVHGGEDAYVRSGVSVVPVCRFHTLAAAYARML